MYNYLIGVDLGKQNDPSAISICRRRMAFGEKTSLPGTDAHIRETAPIISRYDLQHLERIPLGTSYPDVVRKVGTLMDHPNIARQCFLVIDITGVGQAVYDMMIEAGMAPVGVTITGGTSVTESKDGYHVPKRDIVAALQIMFQSQQLRYPPPEKIKDPEVRQAYRQFISELKTFRPKPTKSGVTTFEAWRESDHDDVVLSVGILMWYARKIFGGGVRIPGSRKKEKQTDILRRGLER